MATHAPNGVRRRDVAFAAAVLLVVAAEVIGRPNLASRPVAVGLGIVLAGAVLVRRTNRLAAMGMAFGAFVFVDATAILLRAEPMVLYSGGVVLVVVHALCRCCAGRDVVLGSVIVALEFTVSTVTDFTGPVDAAGGAAVLLVAAALGTAIRYRAVAREQLIERAKLNVREHLARELHDTVAHHVSAIAIQAQAGLVQARSSSPSGTTEALEIIEREAARTLAEMRSMVGALRSRHEQSLPVSPRRLTDIERLGTANTDSLRVDVAFLGDLTGLPPAVEEALHRVAQESVTNAQRHARRVTRVEATVTGDPPGVELTVSENGARATLTSDSGGYGLIGMTERIALLGGTLKTGPGPNRGWCVRAVFPRPRRQT